MPSAERANTFTQHARKHALAAGNMGMAGRGEHEKATHLERMGDGDGPEPFRDSDASSPARLAGPPEDRMLLLVGFAKAGALAPATPPGRCTADGTTARTELEGAMLEGADEEMAD